ncbi:MAG TPA: membrane protein insertase YidC [Bacteroidota bacterium]|nr:membrane protein insertase YidC [Bacteroidota bacterium]
MDRTTVIGFVLIAIVLMVWIWLNSPSPTENHNLTRDSLAQHSAVDTSTQKSQGAAQPPEVSPDTLGKYFKSLAGSHERIYTIRNGVVNAGLSSKGGSIRSWELKDFKTWNGYPVNLVNDNNHGELNLLFYTSDGRLVNTKYLDFRPVDISGSEITLTTDSTNVAFALDVSPTSRILKTYTFYKDKYSFDVTYDFVGMDSIISNFEYQVVWENGLRYQERNSVDESNSAMSYSYSGGELTEMDASAFDQPPNKQNISGKVNWVATRNKYFGLAFIPRDVESHGAYLEGSKKHMPDNGVEETYSLGLKMPFLGKQTEKARITTYLGPLNFDIVKGLNVDLDRIMSLGAAWIIRPISEYVMIPLFKFLHLLIPNYGLVIIVFAFIIKVVLHPLTKTSMTSMKRMQQLQPMIEEIREKQKDDPQKMNMQIMRLYKEYGVNPAGGCLPMLLQLPILYALWAVFRSTIELRQASFVGWIHDLSIPDVITKLPFSIPFFNITEVSGLAFLMGITMFVQQKMTVKDPRQKMMVWMMPVLMTLLFNSFPSGLNLYYFVFNLLSIAQQYWINKSHGDEPLKKVEPKKSKGGIFNSLGNNLPKLK